jgi:hypothetical protein
MIHVERLADEHRPTAFGARVAITHLGEELLTPALMIGAETALGGGQAHHAGPGDSVEATLALAALVAGGACVGR